MAKKALINKQRAAEVPRARRTRDASGADGRAPCTSGSCCAGSASASSRTGRAPGGDEGLMVSTTANVLEQRHRSRRRHAHADPQREPGVQGRARWCRPPSMNDRVLRDPRDARATSRGSSARARASHQAFRVRLKYGKRTQRTITGHPRVSKPGRRVYRGATSCRGCWAASASRSCPRRRAS